MRVKDTAEPLSSSSEGKFDGAQHDNEHGGVSEATGINEHLDPSRLPPAQRQLFMRIQQKQHRDDISSKPISELTAKRMSLFVCRTTVGILSDLCLMSFNCVVTSE